MPDFFFASFSYTWPLYVISAVAYLLGSIPFGLLLSKLANTPDPRTLGSGNIGATNVLRAGHKGLAAMTLVLDFGKGFLATFAAFFYGPDCATAAALAVTLGHIFPIWLKFRGGKGVATVFGVLFVLSWPTALISAITWILVLLVFRFSSLSAIVSLALTPFFLAGLLLLEKNITLNIIIPGTAQNIETFGLLALFVIGRHFRNIRRLLAHKEPKVSLNS